MWLYLYFPVADNLLFSSTGDLAGISATAGFVYFAVVLPACLAVVVARLLYIFSTAVGVVWAVQINFWSEAVLP